MDEKQECTERFDFFDLEYPQVGEPTMESKQRIMIRCRERFGFGGLRHTTNSPHPQEEEVKK
jgi:hypothetical protein